MGATTGFEGSDLLFVFTSNADLFEERRGYTKFHAYAVLNHGGDFHAAARDLARKGYGTGHAIRSHTDPLDRYAIFAPRSIQTND